MAGSKGQAPTVSYNADEKRAERGKSEITIGGKLFHPVPVTVDLMDALSEIAPEVFRAKELDREANPTRELHLVNVQLNMLLHDEQGNEPTESFLDTELDLVDGYALLALLAPDANAAAETVRD